MSLISSKMTFFYKRVFPIIWFGVLAVLFLVGLIKGLADPFSNLPFLIVPIVMAIFGYQFMKRITFNLVDQVFDLGDALLVRGGGQEEQHCARRYQEREFLSLYEPAAGHAIATAAERVRRHDCVLWTGSDNAAVA
jgi:hypothetical protein